MSPHFGPLHGNTLLTIEGENLNIGRNAFLSMCEIIRLLYSYTKTKYSPIPIFSNFKYPGSVLNNNDLY